MGVKLKTGCDGSVGRGPVPRRSSSELFSAYNISLDVYPPLSEYGRADRAVYPYGGEGTLAILATDLEFEGSRVKSPILGRDFNPMGRGDGAYYAQGSMAIYNAKPEWIGEITTGWGNSICNGDAIPTAADLGGNASARKSRHNCDKYLKGPLGGASDSCCGGGWSASDDIAPGKPMPQPMASKGYASEWERETAEEQYWWCRILRDCENECHDFGNSCQCCVQVGSAEECESLEKAINATECCSAACDTGEAHKGIYKVNFGRNYGCTGSRHDRCEMSGLSGSEGHQVGFGKRPPPAHPLPHGNPMGYGMGRYYMPWRSETAEGPLWGDVITPPYRTVEDCYADCDETFLPMRWASWGVQVGVGAGSTLAGIAVGCIGVGGAVGSLLSICAQDIFWQCLYEDCYERCDEMFGIPKKAPPGIHPPVSPYPPWNPHRPGGPVG